MKEVIYSKKKVAGGSGRKIDSVREERRDTGRAYDVLMQAQHCWNQMARFRKDRERARRYVYGDQWGDLIEVNGRTMTEAEYLSSQGSVPLTNNMLRRLVRNVLGVYRSQMKEPTCTARDRDEQRLGEVMSTILQYNMQINEMQELNTRAFEEFLISGIAVQKKGYGWREGRLDCWTYNVQPNCFFVDSDSRDMRGWDIGIIGEVHDLSFGELCECFARKRGDYKRLQQMYSHCGDHDYLMRMASQFGYSRLENYDFLYSGTAGRCRVIEVWRKERKERYRCHDYNTGEIYKIEVEDYQEMVAKENMRRVVQGVAAGLEAEDVATIEAEWFVDNYWYYYYLTPTGEILAEGETPYEHKSHPYNFRAYPLVDGEVHSFVGDVIDQQRYINRLVILYDFLMRSSAKGLLLFPESALPTGMSMEEIADEWARFDGIVVYKPQPGVAAPQQIANNCTNIGISEMLNMQLKFMEDISGVNGALQGKPGYSGMSGTLYAQQTQNATTSLLDLLETFSTFIRAGAQKDVQNIQQFYDEKKTFNIAGRKSVVEYDPDKLQDVQFDLSIAESNATPAYRAMANELLLQIWQSGQITLEQMLEVGGFPFADDLLQTIQAQKEQMQQMQQGMQQAQRGGNEELAAAISGSADQQAVAQAQQLLAGRGQ